MADQHDHIFKELITTFFAEFVELFAPQLYAEIDPDSLTPLPQELFTDITQGDKLMVDILMQAHNKNETNPRFLLIHVENQSTSESDFAKRMFRYFAHLYLKYDVPVYSFALLSFDKPKRAEPDKFVVEIGGKRVVEFNYQVVQLNRLKWRNYLSSPNPVASALMAKMNIAPADRPKVKLECLRMLAGLKLNPARQHLVSWFVDYYLRLNAEQEQEYQQELATAFPPAEREAVMELMTSWKLEGIQQGKLEGKRQGQEDLVLRLLNRQFSPVEPSMTAQVRALPDDKLAELAEALFELPNREALLVWLDQQKPVRK